MLQPSPRRSVDLVIATSAGATHRALQSTTAPLRSTTAPHMLMLLALLPAARALRAPASARAHPTLRRASSVDLSFEAAAAPASTTVYAGLKDAVAQQAPAGVDAALWASLVDSVTPGDDPARD